MRMPSSPASSVGMRSWVWSASPYKGKWQQRFGELQAMETFKKKVSEEEQSHESSYLSILINCFRTYDSNPSPSAYSFIIKYIFQRRLFSHLSPILEHLEKAERFDVPERIFVNMIQGFGRADRLCDAADIFFRIPKFRCTPSVVSLNVLLTVLCKSREGIVLVRDVLLKAAEMNIRLEASTFQILIRALCRNGKLSSAIELLNMMQLHECTPDAKLYSLIFYSLCKQGGSTQVIEFLEEMRNAGFMPSALEYNNAVSILVNEGKSEDAYSFLCLMRMEGKRPDVTSYNRIIDAFILANDFQKADELFDEMLLIGLLPNSATYNIYISGLCKQGNLEQARRMLACMERAGCKPDLETFNTVIAGYIKVDEIANAKELMMEVLEKGLQLNSHTCELLIDGLLSKGEIEEAKQLLMEMTSMGGFTPGLSNFNTLTCSLCQKSLLCEDAKIQEETISVGNNS
ncbi:hypothetical protein Cni_G26796 [Canna indica]|uniref:Pentatricopeptide repeat-containing protein n=1 Tax=Canna indica TaxID=4628 RepID=A0AAQ3KZL4_9LILI|nr:hypothetical protein Cni_G26796 [Canna indica]